MITTHVSRALDFPLFWPSDKKDLPPRLFQLPYLRIPFQGRIGVPIFAFLTGFVCAYKPLKLAYQQGNAPASLKSVARSAFRRPPRLMLPAMIATFISFVLSCLGAYTSANHCDSFWVRFDAPSPMPFRQNVRRFFRALLTTWTSTDNPYDRHQWAMRPLLVGAFQVYVVLAATVGMRFKYRILVHVLMIFYWLLNSNYLTGTFPLCPLDFAPADRRKQRRLAPTLLSAPFWPSSRSTRRPRTSSRDTNASSRSSSRRSSCSLAAGWARTPKNTRTGPTGRRISTTT